MEDDTTERHGTRARFGSMNGIIKVECGRVVQALNEGTREPKVPVAFGGIKQTKQIIKFVHASWMLTAFSPHRVRSMSVATARCSDLSTASRSHFSSSARTPVALPGPFSSDDSTARVSLRYARRNYELRPAFFHLSFLSPASMIENDMALLCSMSISTFYASTRTEEEI